MCLGVPGKIVTISSDDDLMRMGRVSFGGIIKEINLACVPDAKVGDFVIAHAGLALNTLDEAEADRVFHYLRELGEAEQLEAMRAAGENQ